jgi:hypothetical protein
LCAIQPIAVDVLASAKKYLVHLSSRTS